MLFTDAQFVQKTLEENNLHGQPMTLESGYKELYADWSKENESILPKLSAEERTVSFADYTEKRVLKKQTELIEKNEKDPTKQKLLLVQAQRGDLLLVSTDNGNLFDQVITVEEAQKQDPATLRLLSSTLRSSTNNLTEVKEEQNMLHVIKKLREQHFLVEHASVENHKVYVKAIHPHSGSYDVEVSLDENPEMSYTYKFMSEHGTKKVSEAQLPEEYGEASEKPRLTEEERQMLLQSRDQESEIQKNLQVASLGKAATVAALAYFGAESLNKKNMIARAAAAAEQARLQMQSPLVHQNVMPAKLSMAARKARQDKQMAGEKERIQKRKEKYSNEAKQAYIQKHDEEHIKEEKSKEQNSKLMKRMAASAGAATGLFAGAGGLMFTLAHLAHS